MKKTTSFENLIVWQKAHRFVLASYALTKCFPKDETYGLMSQFRRASVSIAANIAEEYKKDVSKESDLLIEVSKLLNAYCKTILNSLNFK